MSVFHERVFKIAKEDKEFNDDLKQTDQKISMFPDSVSQGVWAAGYAGWVLGRYGPSEYMRRTEDWK